MFDTSQATFTLQVLPDDPRDDAHGYAAFHIQAGDGKGHIIFLAGHPVVVAGVGHRIDAVGKPDIDDALVDIGDFAGILALDAALLQVVPVGVFRGTLNVGPDAQVFRTLTPHTEDADQHLITHSKTLMGVADPVPGQIPCQDGALDAEHFHADDFLSHGDHTGLHNAAFVDTVHAVSIQIEVEDLALTHHRLPAAGDHAAGLGVNAPHHKVDVGAQHVAQDLVLAQHQVGVVLARRATAQVDHHFLDGNDDAETLVVHHGHRLTVVQLLDAAQLARQNTAGTVGVVNLMPDDILTVFRRLYILAAADGQDNASCPWAT